ncbi:hypothetical protein RA178_06175 [Shewanella oncorhynchi]|uniref:Uncharacterized protein n=1 Tax=Shewanella oncorhynchi TaxID=2726434 RepID=A0AA50Q7K9_9GAMM|nr:hypothetical protein [Shewanella oncorhynchi]WMB74198.1 hypothetical protein RA178_06175 [Shewanella oncorhynchi]
MTLFDKLQTLTIHTDTAPVVKSHSRCTGVTLPNLFQIEIDVTIEGDTCTLTGSFSEVSFTLTRSRSGSLYAHWIRLNKALILLSKRDAAMAVLESNVFVATDDEFVTEVQMARISGMEIPAVTAHSSLAQAFNWLSHFGLTHPRLMQSFYNQLPDTHTHSADLVQSCEFIARLYAQYEAS